MAVVVYMPYQPGFFTISTSHKLPQMSDFFTFVRFGLNDVPSHLHFLDSEAWTWTELVVVRLVLPRLHFFMVFSTHSYWLRQFWSGDCFAINSDLSFFCLGLDEFICHHQFETIRLLSDLKYFCFRILCNQTKWNATISAQLEGVCYKKFIDSYSE